MMEEFDRTAELEKYGEAGYWPYGTPCPRRVIDGRAGVALVKEKVVQNFGKVPPHALKNILSNPAFKQCRTMHNINGTSETVDECKSDIIDALEILKQEAK